MKLRGITALYSNYGSPCRLCRRQQITNDYMETTAINRVGTPGGFGSSNDSLRFAMPRQFAGLLVCSCLAGLIYSNLTQVTILGKSCYLLCVPTMET